MIKLIGNDNSENSNINRIVSRMEEPVFYGGRAPLNAPLNTPYPLI